MDKKPRQNKSKEIIYDQLPQCNEQYKYVDANNKIVFVVQRYDTDEGNKSFKQFTPRPDNQWKLGLDCSENRPLFNLTSLIKSDPTRSVMVVEGEKCVKLVQTAFPKLVVICWAGGTGGFNKTDWTPLYGRKVMLCADPDVVGYIAMGKIATMLNEHCPKISIILPDINKSNGSDIGDVAQSSPEQLPDWIRANLCQWDAKIQQKIENLERQYKEKQQTELKKNVHRAKCKNLIKNNPNFEIIGMRNDSVVIQNQKGISLYTEESLSDKFAILSIYPDITWWRENFVSVQPYTLTQYILKVARELGPVP